MRTMADVTAEAQREAILEALRKTKGHRGEAAASLGMARRTFTARIASLGMADAIKAEGKRLGWPPATARATAARKSLT
jgi:DNA-binding NtrC family response regulator